MWAIISLFLSLAITYYLTLKISPRKWVAFVQSLIVLGAIAGSLLIGSVTVDSSYDGNWYHKTAIGEMKNGWNPVRVDGRTFNDSAENPYRITGMSADKIINGKDGTPWLMTDHYPKASWVFGANIYSITDNIESGKALTALVIFVVFFFAFGYLYKKFGIHKTLLLALLLAANPVIMMQLFNYYNDGILGNLLIILVIGLSMLIDKTAKIPHKALIVYGAIFMAITLLVNLKFTGIVYAGITVLCYLGYIVYKRDWQVTCRLVAVGAASLLVGLVVIGASTYVKNIITVGNPLYPLIGSDIPIIEGNQPISYADKSGVHKFVEANFSPTANVSYLESTITGKDTDPKIPFTISAEEVELLAFADSRDYRQGGYGVWFSGILIVSILAGIYLLVRHSKANRQILPLFLLPIATVFITIIVVDTTWWARYLPQLYILPVLVVIALFLVHSRFIASFLVFALLFNLMLSFALGLSAQTQFVVNTKETLTAIPCDGGGPTEVYSSRYIDGALYNIYDKCKNVKALHPGDVDGAVLEKSPDIFSGILLIDRK